MNGPGTLYGVGVGPGDPELLTLKAVRVLGEAGVIAVPRSRDSGSGTSVALSIIERAVDLSGKEVVELPMAMTRESAPRRASRLDAARELASRLALGVDVAFVTLGDPMLYSTFTYMAALVGELLPGVRVRSVAGVTSISAAASAACAPLAESGERVVIIPAAYDIDEIDRALGLFDTIVLMKVNRRLDEIIDLLCARGLDGCSVFSSRVGWAEGERVTTDIRALLGEKVDYFSTIIVRRSMAGAAERVGAGG